MNSLYDNRTARETIISGIRPGIGRLGQSLILFCVAGSLHMATLILPSAVFAATDSSWTSVYAEAQNALAGQQFDRAEQLLRKALSLTQSSHNTGDAEKCMLKLADTLALRDKTAEAQGIYEKLLGMLSKKYGGTSAQIAPVLLALGSIQESAGDHARAITYYQKALQINEKNYGPYSPALANSLQGLGRAQFKSGNKKEAEKHYKRSLSILSLDPDLKTSAQMESLMKDYGDLLKGDDNSNKDLIKDFQADILQEKNGSNPSTKQAAAPLPGSNWQQQSRIQFNESGQAETNEAPKVVLRGIQQPASDKALAPAYNVINDSIFKQDHYEKGESYYQRMIAADIDALGPNHPTVANDLNGLARLYLSEKKYSEAQPLLTRALSIYEKAYGSNNMLAINTRTSLAGAEFHLAHMDRAVELYRTALGTGQSALGPNSFETARILNELAYLYFQLGKLPESRTFYEWALASTEGAVGQQDPLVAACLKDYAQVLRGLGQSTEASAAETRAEQILAKAK